MKGYLFFKRWASLFINKHGRGCKCYICGHEFRHFSKYGGMDKNVMQYQKMLRLAGSDVQNFSCIYCHCHDRIRHLFMFFDKLNFWEHFSNARILHFAPEEMLVQSIEARIPAEYIKGDLYPDPKKGIQKIDVTVVGFEDNYFDMIICNHVLEHVSDYKKAMKELFRVMKPGGIGIFQTPYSKLFSYNLEENNINTDSLRSFFYLQNDHVRLYGEKQFFHDLEEVGFILKIVKNSDCFDEKTSVYNGVNKEEDLVQVIKPLPGL